MNTEEELIRERGADVAPRISADQALALIVAEAYHVFPGTTTTVCCLTLVNGMTVIGESACASPENFKADLGQRFAYANAKREIAKLEGYLLRQRLYEAKQSTQESQ